MMSSFVIPRIIPLSKDFFTIPVRQRIVYCSSLKGFLDYSSLKGFLYYSGPTQDFFTIPLSKDFFTAPLSGEFFTIPLSKDFFTTPLSRDFCTIPVRQRILSSLRGFFYYSGPTEDSLLSLSQRISLLFQSDRGFFTIPLSGDSLLLLS